MSDKSASGDHATTDRLSERAHESVDRFAKTAGKGEERIRQEASDAEARVRDAGQVDRCIEASYDRMRLEKRLSEVREMLDAKSALCAGDVKR